MATYAFARSTNSITVNSFTDEYPGHYNFYVDSLNDILVINSATGDARFEIHTLVDTITIDGDAFSGTASELKDDLLESIFLSSAGGSTSDALIYHALLTQSGTDDPVAVVAENTLGELVWSRVSAGYYKGTLTGAFTSNGTYVILQNNSWTDANMAAGRAGNSDEVFVGTASLSAGAFVDSDGLLVDTPIKIMVYPQ